ncbi:MAG: hypothetical protein AMXMBFR64_12730 [Myxococcales bacterium]
MTMWILRVAAGAAPVLVGAGALAHTGYSVWSITRTVAPATVDGSALHEPAESDVDAAAPNASAVDPGNKYPEQGTKGGPDDGVLDPLSLETPGLPAFTNAQDEDVFFVLPCLTFDFGAVVAKPGLLEATTGPFGQIDLGPSLDFGLNALIGIRYRRADVSYSVGGIVGSSYFLSSASNAMPGVTTNISGATLRVGFSGDISWGSPDAMSHGLGISTTLGGAPDPVVDSRTSTSGNKLESFDPRGGLFLATAAISYVGRTDTVDFRVGPTVMLIHIPASTLQSGDAASHLSVGVTVSSGPWWGWSLK